MPRDLPLGNGDFLVNFDARYQLRDVFYPNVGLENHTVGEPCRFGLWVDGKFSWINEPSWERAIDYEHETLVGDTHLRNGGLGIALHCRDAVDFDRNLYFKEVTVEDQTGRKRDVRLFQHFDAHLYGNEVGDSAYYDPRSQAIVHYKGRRYFLLSGTTGSHALGLTSFAIGQKDAPGREGTWRDAEDGELSRNPVAQGSIDSVGMLAAIVPAGGSTTYTFWLAAGQAYDEVRELDKLVRERTPASFLARTKDYWRLWANKDETIADHISTGLARLYKRSTLVIRTQVDNRGAIIAGNDSDVLRFNRDTYSYLWPRDGALVADALDLAGYGEVTRRFFFLCGELITREGYLLHKYNPDGSLGSSWHAWSTPDGRLDREGCDDCHLARRDLPIWSPARERRACDLDDARDRTAPLGEDSGRRARPLRERLLLPGLAGHRQCARESVVRGDAVARRAPDSDRHNTRGSRAPAGVPRVVHPARAAVGDPLRASAPVHRRALVGVAANVVARRVCERGAALLKTLGADQGPPAGEG